MSYLRFLTPAEEAEIERLYVEGNKMTGQDIKRIVDQAIHGYNISPELQEKFRIIMTAACEEQGISLNNQQFEDQIDIGLMVHSILLAITYPWKKPDAVQSQTREEYEDHYLNEELHRRK